MNLGKFKPTKKKVIIIVCILAVGAFAYTKMTTKAVSAPQGVMVSTSNVVKKSIEDSITLKAPLEGTESIELVSKLHYKVLAINVNEGDKVTNGQVLATLDSSTLQDEIKSARSNLELRRAEINQKVENANKSIDLEKTKLEDSLKDKQVEYDKALDALNEAERNYNNIKVLVEGGVETEENLKKAEVDYNDKKRALEAYNVIDGVVQPDESEVKGIETSQGDVNISNGKASATGADLKTIEIAQQTLDTKLKDLQDCEIKSSIDGTVTRVNVKVGRFADEIDNDKPMFVVENIDKLQMKVYVSEYDISKIKEGQEVEISADILKGETVKGVVSKISPTGETKSDGSTERVVPTQIDILENNPNLIAGITAKAKISIAKSENAFVVPIETISENEDGTQSVYRVNSENKIEIVPVETGIENDIEIEIKSDKIQDGDTLVISPTYDLTEGTLVSTGMGM